MGRRAGQEYEVGVGDDHHQRLEGMATVSIILEGSWVAGSWSDRAARVIDNKGQWTRSMAAIGDRHYHLGGMGDTAAATRSNAAMRYVAGPSPSSWVGLQARGDRMVALRQRQTTRTDGHVRRPLSMTITTVWGGRLTQGCKGERILLRLNGDAEGRGVMRRRRRPTGSGSGNIDGAVDGRGR